MPGIAAMPCWVTLLPFCSVSEYCSLRGSDLLSEVPNLLCTSDGSTRASIAVLSQIEPTPGAVIAAHAAPEDCCSPVVIFCCSASAAEAGCCRATVRSAPTLVSQNGIIDCLTDNAAAPLDLSCADQDDAAPSATARLAFGSAGVFASPAAADAGSSWLQSMSELLRSTVCAGAASAA